MEPGGVRRILKRCRADAHRLLDTSLNHFDVRPVTWRFGERRVAGDDRRIERLCQGDVHGVVRRDVLAQLPRASQELEMGVTVEIEMDYRRAFQSGSRLPRNASTPSLPSSVKKSQAIAWPATP